MADNVAAQLRPQFVTQHVSTMVDKAETLMGNVNTVSEHIVDAALMLGQLGDQGKLALLRQELLALASVQAEVAVHKVALQQLMGSYSPGLEPTGFKKLLVDDVRAAVAASGAVHDSGYIREFDDMVAEATGGVGAGDGDEELDEDGLAVGSVELNANCPYTQKAVMDCEDPVEDSVGYVYERAAIEAAIRHSRVGWVEAPFVGASHPVTLESLKPSRRVARARRVARLGLQLGTQRRGPNRDEVVLEA